MLQVSHKPSLKEKFSCRQLHPTMPQDALGTGAQATHQTSRLLFENRTISATALALKPALPDTGMLPTDMIKASLVAEDSILRCLRRSNSVQH